jgi:hypothetical protein
MNQDSRQTQITQLPPDPVQTIFADGLHTIAALNGCVRIEFFTEHAKADNPGRTYATLAGRVVIPQSRLAPLIQAIGDLARRLESQRASERMEPKKQPSQTPAEAIS